MTERRYIVRGKVAKSAAHVKVEAGETVYLYWTSEAGGWFNWSPTLDIAKPFKTIDEARDASRSNGPWYYVPSPESIEILPVDYTPPQAATITFVTPGHSISFKGGDDEPIRGIEIEL